MCHIAHLSCIKGQIFLVSSCSHDGFDLTMEDVAFYYLFFKVLSCGSFGMLEMLCNSCVNVFVFTINTVVPYQSASSSYYSTPLAYKPQA